MRASPPLIRFSDGMRKDATELKRFLFANLYRHPQVAETRQRAEEVLRDLFRLYAGDPALLPAEYLADGNVPRAIREAGNEVPENLEGEAAPA